MSPYLYLRKIYLTLSEVNKNSIKFNADSVNPYDSNDYHNKKQFSTFSNSQCIGKSHTDIPS